MFSKPVAVLLLVAALFGGAVGGAYIALKVYDRELDDDPLIDVDESGPLGVEETVPARGGARSPKRDRPKPPSPSGPGNGPSVDAGSGPVAVPGGSGRLPGAAGPGSTETSEASDANGTEARKEPTFEDIEVPRDTLVAIRLQAALSSETARVEDRVEARVTKPVQVRGKLVIPPDTLVVGDVTVVDKGGPMSDRARLDVRFHTLRIPHTAEVAILVDAISTVGPSPTKGTKGRVVGGAAGGAALGWLKGGIAGAITGGAIGGGAGVGARVVEGRQPIDIPAGSETQLQLRAPAVVTVPQ